MGLRERKAARAREEISRVAIGLFCERGFDAVTMTEVAEAAEVGRATLFAYFPTKEALVLDRVRDYDPCRVFRERAAGVSLVESLRGHYRDLAAGLGPGEGKGTKRIVELIMSTPALTAGLQRMFDRQRDELAVLLADEDGGDMADLTAQIVAGQAIGMVLAVKTRIYQRLVGADSTRGIRVNPAEEVDRAFGLLENGIGIRYRRKAA